MSIKGDIDNANVAIGDNIQQTINNYEISNELVDIQRKARVMVHKAYFINNTCPYFFINVTNLSYQREIEITHVWFDCDFQVSVMQPSRPLPRRLKTDESWETWIEVDAIPKLLRNNAFTLARVRLSSGEVITSVKNEGVPHTGTVPG